MKNYVSVSGSLSFEVPETFLKLSITQLPNWMKMSARTITISKIFQTLKLWPRWRHYSLRREIGPNAYCNDIRQLTLGSRTDLGAGVGIYLTYPLEQREDVVPMGTLTLGDNSSMGSYTTVSALGGNVRIGNNTHIGTHCHFGSFSRNGITIGSNVLVASHVSMVATQHIFTNPAVPIIEQSYTALGITVEDNVWLGANVVIMDGVTVGTGAIVAAGAVVRTNVEPFTIVGGVPAKFIKRRPGT